MHKHHFIMLTVGAFALVSCNPFRNDSAVQVSAKDENLNSRWHANLATPAELAGAMVNRLDGEGGMFTAEQVEEALWPDDRYMPRSRVVSVEQTTNMGGSRADVFLVRIPSQ